MTKFHLVRDSACKPLGPKYLQQLFLSSCFTITERNDRIFCPDYHSEEEKKSNTFFTAELGFVEFIIV